MIIKSTHHDTRFSITNPTRSYFSAFPNHIFKYATGLLSHPQSNTHIYLRRDNGHNRIPRRSR